MNVVKRSDVQSGHCHLSDAVNVVKQQWTDGKRWHHIVDIVNHTVTRATRYKNKDTRSFI